MQKQLLLTATAIAALTLLRGQAEAKIGETFEPAVYQNIIANDIRAIIGSYHSRKAVSWGGADAAADVGGAGFSETMTGLWLRTGYGESEDSGNPYDVVAGFEYRPLSYEESMVFAQAGVTGRLMNTGDGSVFGSVFGFGSKSKADTVFVGGIGAGSGKIDISAWGGGAELTYEGRSGLYADALAALSFHDVGYRGVGFSFFDSDANALDLALAGEVGYRFAVSEQLSFVPRVRMNYQNISFNNFSSFSHSETVSSSDNLEASLGFLTQLSLPMSNGNVSKLSFGADLTDVFSDKSIQSNGSDNVKYNTAKETAIVLSAGFETAPAANGLTIGIDANYRVPLVNDGFNAWGATAKLGWTW
jgi:hypothetical protein